MNSQQVAYVCKKYASILDGLGAKPVNNPKAESRESRLDHLRWMCDEIPGFCQNGQPFETDSSISGREKAMRWLGFVQGAFSSMGVRSIEDMRDDNR